MIQNIQLEKDEKVILMVRKHWFVLFSDLIRPGIVFFVPFIGYIFLHGSTVPIGTEELTLSLSPALAVFLFALWSLLFWATFVRIWTEYYLDLWTITDRRIIDIEQTSFFSRNVASLRMERIQDVTIDIHGVLPTLLHFGDLHVQTAGMSREFVVRGIPRPRDIKNIVLQQQDRVVAGQKAHAPDLPRE